MPLEKYPSRKLPGWFRFIRLSLFVLVLLIGLTACTGPSSANRPTSSQPIDQGKGPTAATEKRPGSTTVEDTRSQATSDRFRVGEIRDYQGMNLDPAIGPRDNSIAGIQQVDLKSYRLTIDGLVQKPVELTYDEVLALPADERQITLFCVEGWQATILWKGVRIEDLIELAGGDMGDAATVIFHCVDGYTTSLSLFMIKDWDIILAYESNGLPLPAELGFPFMVVAERKYGYKWARWVNRIELSADAYYRGYWESRGWSNNASIYDE